MKKIIRGRLYDTDTAKRLGGRDAYSGTFEAVEETLYRKRNGEFFLHGSGGPASAYRRYINHNEWAGGDDIRPMSYDCAREWAERYLSTDEYIKIFGPIPEDNSLEFVTLRVRRDIMAKVRRYSSASGRTISDIVQSLLERIDSVSES